MKYFDNQFLFSETYINEYVKGINKKIVTKDEKIIDMLRNAAEWNKEYTTGELKNDPWMHYIDALLDVLGFQNKEIKENIRVLYTNHITTEERPVAICYEIDKEEDINSTMKGKYYAYKAVRAAKVHNVNWAILTNGNKWRLYNVTNISPYEYYLEIDIEECIKGYPELDEAFNLFNLFFNVRRYYTEDAQLIIEKIKDKSDKTAENIEEFLRGKSEEILKNLCYGLKESMNKQIYTNEDRKNIYNDAIILLYRLLFLGYAESRGLLPIKKADPNYTCSFEKLCLDAKETLNSGQLLNTKDGFDFWERLDSNLRLYVDSSYNGGLFHNDDKPILVEHKITNQYLILCLAEISYNKDKSGKYTSKIEYKDLSVRNLGVIYEGLLEFRLFIAEERIVQKKNKNKVTYIKASEISLKTSDFKSIIEPGGIYLSQDAMERKETGAYYTPEDVVEYIVNNTVGKKLSELSKQLKEILEPYYNELNYVHTEEDKRKIHGNIDTITYKFINEKILILSIIDSAMGSGHFLVNAAYRLATEIVSIIEDNNWQSMDEISVDIKEWKRKVVENCIYGIDINELSVALAKLSLWLISASNDKALSFIDHHLKTGDSIIGATKSQVNRVLNENQIRKLDILPDVMLEVIIRRINKVNEIGSSTKHDVEMQKAVYEQIEDELNIIKKKFDYYLATLYAGGIEDKNEYINIMRFGGLADFEKSYIQSYIQLAHDNKFFHWELEFPEVFAKGGFDVFIGNPPYTDIKTDINFLKKLGYKTSDSGDIYTLCSENMLRKTKRAVYGGLIVPLSLTFSRDMKSLRKYLMTLNSKIYISSYDRIPDALFGSNVRTRNSILIIIPSEVTEIYATPMVRWFSSERKYLFRFLNYSRVISKKALELGIPKIGSYLQSEILFRILNSSDSLKDSFVRNSKEVVYYKNTAYNWITVTEIMPPVYDEKNRIIPQTQYKAINVRNEDEKYIIIAIINSTIFYWFWLVFGDGFHVTKELIQSFPICIDNLNSDNKDNLISLGKRLQVDMIKNTVYKLNAGKKIGNYNLRYCKNIISGINLKLSEVLHIKDNELADIISHCDSMIKTGLE